MDSVLQAGVVSAPLQVIIDRLASFTVQETSQILGVDEEIRKLQRTLERIRAIVGHVEENRSIFSDSHSAEAWKVWLKDVEELLYSADDLLDGISLDLSKHRASRSAADGEDKQVRDMLLSSFKLTVPREISRIRQELGDIAKEMDAIFMIEVAKLGTDKKLKCRPAWCSSYSCGRSSLVDEEYVVGRDRERTEIVEMLLDQELSRTNVSVIPIVGMGGIGKTTLAQIVYNDHRLVGKFDLRMWASVSMDLNTISVTKSIIESASGERCKLFGLDPIQVTLQNLLRGKKFLLVLDDYWSEEYSDWDMLCSPFKVGARGSMIILTTRNSMVSRILGTVPSYCLESLNDENCWQLMKQRACANRTLDNDLERIGRMIARKCRGLPLAAKTLGSMLHFKDDPIEWRSILESGLWDLPQDKNDIFPALALSYYHLPPQLKKCFTYCSIFPKNHAFEANELVLLWMAEGFVRPVGKIRPEDVGNDYFKGLLCRSFFQFSLVNVHGQNVYKMHDLIHDLAQLISTHACLRREDNQPTEECTSWRNTRHFSLHCQSPEPVILKGSACYKNLRTFKVIRENFGNIQVSYDLFLKLKALRVLELSHLGLDELPDSIDHLKHLRYLNLSENHFRKLPESVTNFLVYRH